MVLKCIVEVGKGKGFPVHAFKAWRGSRCIAAGILISSPFVIEYMWFSHNL